MSESLFDTIKNKFKNIITPTTTPTSPTIVPNAKGGVLNTAWENIGTFGKIIFILIIIILFVLILNLGIYFITYLNSSSQNIPIYLINGVSSGYTPTTIIQNPNTNPDKYVLRSNNRNNGAEFTWSIWLYIKDIVSNGKENSFQNIFNKGNNQYDTITGISTINNAPGLYLSKNTNTLRVIMDTVANNPNVANNYTDITNIPLGKWFHLAIRLQDRNLDTYINGIVATRLYLIDVPKQNYDPIYVCQNGGFSGNYSDLFYYNYSLYINEIQTLVFNGPGLNYSPVHIETETSTLSRSTINNYLSPLWYFGENSSPIDLSLNILNNQQFEMIDEPTVLKPNPLEINQQFKTIDENGVLVPGTISDNYDTSGNLVEKGLIEKPLLNEKSTVGVQEQTIAQIIKSIPFSLSSLLFSTNFTDMMDGDVRALDQHNIDCSGSAINSFQYINPGDGTFNYTYKCNNPKGGNMTEVVPNTTAFTNTTGSTLDLANQNIQCPSNSVLSQFQLTNNSPLGSEATATQLQYKYKCLQSNDSGTQPLTCRTVNTPFNRMNANTQYLSKSNITCEADEALSGFQYILSSDSKQYQYRYTCCKTPYSGG